MKALTENLGLKIFSLILAIVLYLYISQLGESETTIGAEVGLILKPPPGMLITSEVAESVRLNISGPWGSIRGFNPREMPPLHVDLSEFGPGPATYYLHADMIEIPPGLRVMSITPSLINVHLEPAAEKKVRIAANLSGKPAQGFKIARYNLTPKELTIYGPRGLVEKIDFVMTEPVDVTDLFKSFTREVKIHLDNEKIERRHKDPVQIEVIFSEDISSVERCGVRVAVKDARHWAVPIPQSVCLNLRGPTAVVERVTAQSLTAVVELGKVAVKGSGRFRRQIQVEGLPEEVRLVGKPPQVTIMVSKEP